MKKQSETEKFNVVMDALLAVPYSELQEKLDEEKRAKAKEKKRTTSSASALSSSDRKQKAD